MRHLLVGSIVNLSIYYIYNISNLFVFGVVFRIRTTLIETSFLNIQTHFLTIQMSIWLVQTYPQRDERWPILFVIIYFFI